MKEFEATLCQEYNDGELIEEVIKVKRKGGFITQYILTRNEAEELVRVLSKKLKLIK